MKCVSFLATIASVGILTAAAPKNTAWETLDAGLKSENVEHRMQALAALSTIRSTDDAAVKRAEEALQHDKSGQVRREAALALGRMKATQSIPALKDALEDNGEVAFAAAKSLTELGDPAGRGMLIAVLAGERKDTPGMMTNALREAKRRMRHPEGLILMGVEDAAGTFFGPASMGIPAATSAMDLKGKGAPGRAAAAAYLAKDKDPYAVTLLEWALADDSHFVRIEAAKGLADRGNSASIPKLESLFKDEHTSVRFMAAAAVINISGRTQNGAEADGGK